MVLTEDTVYFLASKKKIEFLQKVEGSENGTTVKLLTRDKVCFVWIFVFTYDMAMDLCLVIEHEGDTCCMW